MYKVISGFLFVAFFLAAGIGAFKVWSINKENIKLSNQLVQSQKVVQETKSAYSVAAQKLSDLETSNKELQNKIEDRDEKVAALSNVTLKLKDQLFKIKNVKVVVVDESGQPTNDPLACDIPNLRIDFEKEQDPWTIQGHCWTNPPGAEVAISWVRPLQFSFVLAKKNEQYRLYFDNNSPDIVVVENLSLRIDPSVFEKYWYEKLELGTDLGWSGSDPTIAVRGTMDVGSFAVGPFISFFNGKDGLTKSVGLSIGYRPF